MPPSKQFSNQTPGSSFIFPRPAYTQSLLPAVTGMFHVSLLRTDAPHSLPVTTRLACLLFLPHSHSKLGSHRSPREEPIASHHPFLNVAPLNANQVQFCAVPVHPCMPSQSFPHLHFPWFPRSSLLFEFQGFCSRGGPCPYQVPILRDFSSSVPTAIEVVLQPLHMNKPILYPAILYVF